MVFFAMCFKFWGFVSSILVRCFLEHRGNLQRVELILEGPVLASEVELHSDPVVDPAPVADETLQLMEPVTRAVFKKGDALMIISMFWD